MALKEVLASYLVEVKGVNDLDRADQSSNRLTKGLRGLGTALAAVATVGVAKGLFSWVNDVADGADATDKFATAIGASARDVAEWDMVLGNAGVSLEKGRIGLRTFAKQSGEAARGSKELRSLFSRLGVQSRDTAGRIRPLNDRLTDTVLGLSKIEDPARRAAAAEKLFGEAGLGFVRVALDGAGALEAQRREFDELHGGGSYEQFIKDSKAAAVANDRWRNATQALRVVIAGALVPVLTTLVVGLSRATRWITRMVSGTKIVRVALATLAGVAGVFAVKLAIAFAPALVTVGLFAALLGGAILILEDIYQLFTGGESLIEEWIDSWLGAGEAQKLVGQLKDGVSDLVGVFETLGKIAIPIIDGIRKAITFLSDAVKGILKDLDEAASRVAKRTGITAGIRTLARGAKQQAEEAAARGETGEVQLSPEVAGRAAAATAQKAGIRGGEEAARFFGPSPEDLRGGLTRRFAPFGVNLNAPTTINVQGAADPEETARRVLEAVDARDQDNLRRVRDQLGSR